MDDPISISLQAFPPPDKEKESLQYLIQRINAQRGSFRNVTEESLEEEIRNLGHEHEPSEQEIAGDLAIEQEKIPDNKDDVKQAKDQILKLAE